MATDVIPSTISRKLVTKEHVLYPDIYQQLRFGRESYEGSGGYAPFLDDVLVADTQPDDQQTGTIAPDDSSRTHLFRHPREKKKFQRRRMMAYLTNVIKKAIQMIGGFLTKKQPIYDEYPQAVKDWMSSVNASGDTWEAVKSADIWPMLAYYGVCPLIFFRSPTAAVTAYQQIREGGDLRVDIINPENIIDWQLSADGGYIWLKVKTTVDLTEPMDEKPTIVERYTWYTQDCWFYVDVDESKSHDLAVKESGTWVNGLPIVVWRLKGGALTADANAVQREAYNINSLIQEQERETTFSMLRAPGDAPRAGSRVITGAVDNVFYFPEQSRHVPEWMAPPPHVLGHLMAKRQVLSEEILGLMGLDFDGGGGTTGVAFQFKMSKIVRLLQGLATSLSLAESRSLERVALELKETLGPKVRCVWPTEFDAKDVEKELDSLERVAVGVPSAAAKEEAHFRIATTAISNMDETLRTLIRKEIKQSIEDDDLDLDDDNALTPEQIAEAQAKLRGSDIDSDDPLRSDGSAR